MSKNVFKQVTVWLLSVALLGPGIISASANPANLSGHPDPAELGSITINLRTGTDETNYDTAGVPIENVPIRIELVTLNTGVAAPTLEQLQDPAWITANTSVVSGSNIDRLTNENGVVVFDDLPQGIWLVSQLDSLGNVTNPIPPFRPGTDPVDEISDRFTPFLVGLPTHMADGTYRLHVEVWPKVERERLTGGTKEGIEIFDNIITWEFGINIPASIGTARSFYLLDTLDERLEFTGLVTGRFTPATGTDDRALQATHFEATVHEVNGVDVVRIALTPAGIAEIAAHGDLVDGRLYFTMETRLTIEDNNDLGDIENNAVWRFNPEEPFCPDGDPDCDDDMPSCPIDDPTCEDVESVIRTFALNILKLSVADRQPLQGAEFTIYREVSEGTTGATTFTVTRNGTTTTHHVIPLRNADDTPMTGETDASGILQFNGINSTNQIFWLRETEAPDGFRLIDEWMQVLVTQENANNPLRDANNEIQDPVNGMGYVIPVNVYNERQRAWILPETGGVGTIILTVAGIALLGGALVLFVGSKKEEEDLT
jgi:LPXTG-motif cell wall-anchored protein